MRICFLSRRFFPAISGMSVYALNLLRELVRDGHDVVMISQYRNDHAGAAVYGGGPPPAVPGVEVVGLESHGEQVVGHGQPADFEADVAALVQAVEEAHAQRPFDLIHAQYGYPTGLAALEASRRLDVPNVVSIQGGDGHWVGTCCETHRQAMQAVLNHAGALIIGSRSFAEEVVHNHEVELSRFTIIPGATNTERFHPATGRRLGDLRQPPTLLYHGRVDARKGVFELLESVAELRQRGHELRLLVSGIGPDWDAVDEWVRTRGLGNAIELTGYADYHQAPGVYHRGDLFISPTYSEGFSNTILEAMATGLPIVSTRSVGVVDCLTDEENALLVKPQDVEGLTQAIERMLTDDLLRRRLAEQGYQDVKRLYSWPVIAKQIQAVYAQLVGERPSGEWIRFYNPQRTVADSDLSCRFRAAPHLL